VTTNRNNQGEGKNPQSNQTTRSSGEKETIEVDEKVVHVKLSAEEWERIKGEREQKGQHGQQKARRPRKQSQRRRKRGRPDEFSKFIRFMRKMEHSQDPVPDAVASNLMSVIGSVPSFAVSESMIAQSQAQGMMMANQVANQQRVNNLSMFTTAKCVAEMMNINNPKGHDVVYSFEDDDNTEETGMNF